MDRSQEITKELTRALQRLDAARKELAESLMTGQTLTSELVDRVQKAEGRYEIWSLIGKAHGTHAKKVGVTADMAVRRAIVIGRKRCLDLILSGPSGSSSQTHRALSEAKLSAVRDLYCDLEGLENSLD
ncbi:hypothetical protein [Streptomyces albogriseolus]|uniref:hypothetical protein n=1 Tax=Streptomyces albogriseolus TaxID=1887 RepID=UPI003460E511